MIIMESTTDFDLEELESRLYSQVFHSTKDWDTPCSLNNIQTRHVSTYTVNNVPMNINRYWIANNSASTENNVNTNLQQESVDSLNIEPPSQGTIVSKQISNTVESELIPSSCEGYRSKPLKFRSILIPTNFKLPKSTVRKLPDHIIAHFNLGRKGKKNFRKFLKQIEEEDPDNNNKKENERKLYPRKRLIITRSQTTRSNLVQIRCDNTEKKVNEIITLSDSESDGDSVIEIPLPPVPTYTVDSSSEDEPILDNSPKETENNIPELIETTNDENKDEESVNIDTNAITQTEIEREEFLHTPDSNNDFLDHDNTLSKTNLSFNFGLHSSDLDLTKDKDETLQKSSLEHDLYETESSCSDMGSIASKSRPVFNEINFENPTKDIFCEPDLSKFSNFITPDRRKIQSNTPFTSIQTKATNINEEEESRRRSRSESSEYHSDSTTLKSKRKSSKSKKKMKKRDKSEAVADATIIEKPQNIDEVATPSPQIENREFGPEIDTSDRLNQLDPISAYYKDTYFADDNLLLEEIVQDEPEAAIKAKTTDFSFVETYRKSSEKSSHSDKEESPNKKQKTDTDVVTVISDESNSQNAEKNSNVDADIQIVNVEDNKKPKNFVVNPFSFLNTYIQHNNKKTFKDFYTNDMRKFYEDSWGQENFDVRAAQSFMSDNPADWQIIPSDIYPVSPKIKGPRCFRCKEKGHREIDCTFRGELKCSTCGFSGHTHIRCPNSFCTTCRAPTRSLATSCSNCVHFKNMRCGICSHIGHESKNCPDLWRRYHLTTKNSSELKRSTSAMLKAPNKQWCSNCAKKGHFNDQCTNLMHNRFPVTPEIISYEPSYGENNTENLQIPNSITIPYLKDDNVTIDDLRGLRRNVFHDTNRKYINILKQLRQKCGKYDTDLKGRIDELRYQQFNKKNINEIYKIRARIEKNKVS